MRSNLVHKDLPMLQRSKMYHNPRASLPVKLESLTKLSAKLPHHQWGRDGDECDEAKKSATPSPPKRCEHLCGENWKNARRDGSGLGSQDGGPPYFQRAIPPQSTHGSGGGSGSSRVRKERIYKEVLDRVERQHLFGGISMRSSRANAPHLRDRTRSSPVRPSALSSASGHGLSRQK